MNKKITFLIILICFLFLLTSLQNAMIYGTEYADITSNYNFTILEYESLACNGYTGTFQEWSNRVGSSPYLDEIDDNDAHNAIGRAFIKENKSANKNEGWFTFNDTTQKGDNLKVNFTFRVSCLHGDNDGFYVHYDETGSDSGTGTEGPLVQIASSIYINTTVTLTGTFNATEVNNMRIMLHTDKDTGSVEIWVDYVKMTIYRGP